MYQDVIDLRDFYQSRLGQATRRTLGRKLRLIWPDVSGMTVLGLGYATPYLRQMRDTGARVIAAMPAAQGVLHWPRGEPNLAFLADEGDLPLADESVDRVLLVHALERTEQLRPMLRDVWRVLKGNGRVLVVAPNRRGIWARLDRTPFGHGEPFSPGQLSRLLRDTLFLPTQSSQALFTPPSDSRVMLNIAPAWEAFGDRWFPQIAGVVVVEASKQLYALPQGRMIGGRAAVGRRTAIALPGPSRNPCNSI